MHRSSKSRGAALAILLALAGLARPAPAAIQRITTNDDTQTQTFGGSSDHLPVRPNLTWRQAVAWARTMPAVQAAMQTCAARGYVAQTAHDSALVFIDQPATVVVFPYRRPGLVLPQYHYGQPLLMVVTTLNQEGEPATRITCGILIVDADKETAFSADSLPALAASDPSFDVQTVADGDGGPEQRRYRVVTTTQNWFANPESKFNKFIRCWGMNSLATCIRPLISVFRLPGGALLELGTAEELGFYLAICSFGTGLGCLWAVW